MDPLPVATSTPAAVSLHDNHNTTENNVEDADMSTNTECENEDEIIINQEMEIEEECFIQTTVLKNSSERIPVVYTTRLDDMLIIKKDFESLTVDDIVENIILESKPGLTGSYKHQTENIKTFSRRQFHKLIYKIRQFNTFCNVGDDDDEVSEEDIPLKLLSSINSDLSDNRLVERSEAPTSKSKIEKLLNRCRPCTVYLVPTFRVISFNGLPHVIYDKECNVRMPFMKGVRYKIDFGCIVVFKHLKTKYSETYIFAKEGMITKTYEGFEFPRVCSSKHNYSLIIEECCWFYRKYVINSLIWHKTMNPHTLRKPHSCPFGECNCCCKNILIEDDDVEEVPVATSTESAELLSSLKQFVCDALEYNRKHIVRMDNKIATIDLTKEENYLGIQILKNYSDMTEFYELKSDGNIIKHIELKSKYLHMSNNFRRAVKLNADSDKVFCCWRKRDQMLRTFEFRHIPMITQFMRTPHTCPPRHCICCCKPSSLKPLVKVDKLTSFKYAEPVHGYNHMSIIKQRRKFLAKPKNMNKSELENVTSNLQNNIIESEPINLLCNELLPLDVSKAGDVINKTIDFMVTQENNAKKKNIEEYVAASDPPKRASPNRSICETVEASSSLIGQKSPLQKESSKKRQKRVVKTPVHRKILPKVPKPNNIIKQVPVASPTTQPLQLAPRPPVPGKPLPSTQILPQTQLLQVPQNPGPSQLVQSTVAPTQNDIAFPHNNLPPTVSPPTNIPLQNDAQNLTVNTLVNSILHRFNEVRLIITPDGDVSAELNMPVQNLSQEELRILSRILAHAKEQVKAIKAAGHLNSGTNTVLNPWPENFQNNPNLTQTPGAHMVPSVNTTPVIIQNTPTAPVVIANTNLTDEPILVPGPSIPNVSSAFYKRNKENVITRKSQHDAYQCYTNLSALKMKEYLSSCKSYLNDIKFAPKIEDVFSLNENVIKKQNTPAVQSLQSQVKDKMTEAIENISEPNTSGTKRKRNQNPRSNFKKPKIVEVIDKEEDDNDSVAESLMATLIPVSPTNTSTIPITAPADMMPAVTVSGILNPPVVPGSSSVIDPNQVYVAVPTTETPSLNIIPVDDTPTKDEDCILGF